MQDPNGVMVGLAENIQACLRIFRRAQHQWLARDILHQAQGVFPVFVLWSLPTGLIRPIRLIRGRKEGEPVLRRTALQADTRWCVMNPRALPPVTQSSALQAPERMWVLVLCIALQAPECLRGNGDDSYFCLTSTIRPRSHTWSCWT